MKEKATGYKGKEKRTSSYLPLGKGKKRGKEATASNKRGTSRKSRGEAGELGGGRKSKKRVVVLLVMAEGTEGGGEENNGFKHPRQEKNSRGAIDLPFKDAAPWKRR